MTQKQFETSAIIALGISLLYVPTEACNAYLCVSQGWEFITSIERPLRVDFMRLILQEASLGLIIFAIWRNKFKS
jgi:hypothetical protein